MTSSSDTPVIITISVSSVVTLLVTQTYFLVEPYIFHVKQQLLSHTLLLTSSTRNLKTLAHLFQSALMYLHCSLKSTIKYFYLFQITNLMPNSFILQQYVCYTTILNMFRAARCSKHVEDRSVTYILLKNKGILH